MKAPSEDIKDLLEAESGLDLVLGENLFISEMPDSPNLCVCVYDTPGDSPDVGIDYERPAIQITVRGERGAYLAAHGVARGIRDALKDRHNESINEARYVVIRQVGEVNFIGYDDNHRPLLTVNFRADRTGA